MSLNPNQYQFPLKPGMVVEIGALDKLPAFENMVAESIDPNMTVMRREAWDGRQSVKELVRPSRYPRTGRKLPVSFNGSVVDIMLEAFDDPYDQLVTARSRGLRILGQAGGGNFGHFRRNTEDNPNTGVDQYHGFQLTATATSTGRGTIGQVQAELFYFPVARTSFGGSQARNNGGSSICRALTAPIIEPENFVTLADDSRRIGIEVLRQAMTHPTTIARHN